jgi:predicted metalloprotease
VRWKNVPGRGDVEDRRGQGGGPFGGGGFPIPIGKGGGGIGLLVLLALALLFGGNIIGGGSGSGPLDPGGFQPAPETVPGTQTTGNDDVFEFTKFVAKDTQDLWAGLFQQAQREYTRAPVVTFTSGTQTGCGVASSATGPFYCPADHKVYLDLSFFQELSRRFGAPGDFAAAYVIAHEIGHHVQSLIGIERDIRQQQQEDPQNANLYLVRLELQADCFAGVWGHSTRERGLLEPGDVDEGLAAASAVGDDRLGANSPEQWTHGSSALRTQWFRKGLESGDPDDCDTSGVDV